MRIFLLYSLGFALCASSLHARLPFLDDQDDPWSFNIFFENDLFADTDQNYTNGVKVSWVSPDLTQFLDESPKWLNPVVKHLPFINAQDRMKNLGISIGQNMYTPQDITRFDLIEDDRPYAGWLYLGFAFHSKTENILDTFEFQFGIVGPQSYAESAQKFIHELRNLQRPNGWHNQIKNEPGLVIIYEHKQRLLRKNFAGPLQYDLIGRFGGALGNVYTYANVGGEARFGWNIPMDFGTPVIRPTGDITAIKTESDFGIHIFGSTEGRLVLRDIFLDGNTFTDSHSVEKKNAVADVAAGVTVNWAGLKLSYAQVFRTKEFDLQRDDHTFGSVTLSFSY